MPQSFPTLSILDPVSGGYVNIDGGAKSNSVLFYSILVELRTLNAQMQLLTQQNVDETQLIRADQSVAEPLFTQVR